MSFSDEHEEPKLLPLQVDIPKEHLPEVLDVYDKQALALFREPLPRGSFYTKKTIDENAMAKYRSWAKFVARWPIKYVRKYPVPVPTKDDEGMFIPGAAPPVLS